MAVGIRGEPRSMTSAFQRKVTFSNIVFMDLGIAMLLFHIDISIINMNMLTTKVHLSYDQT